MFARFMIQTRGINRHSHITGRSVHNQRIERLWRDVFDQVIDLFYTTFRRMEDEGWLNPDQDVDLFALHWTYLIQRHLQEFQSAWNSHSLRTEGNKTPLQLWSNHERDASNQGKLTALAAPTRARHGAQYREDPPRAGVEPKRCVLVCRRAKFPFYSLSTCPSNGLCTALILMKSGKTFKGNQQKVFMFLSWICLVA
ncbi:uncharacterized protein [Paramisgurnus dabryanus]|uniref:uncharacterized protein isoform X2 n=1 Tax=Paramisgurnus dabryanus TaxID=90735 RepID=UPI0031F33C52